MKLRLAGLLLLIAPQATAAWIGLCDRDPQQAGVRVIDTVIQPTGQVATLVASDKNLGNCTLSELPVAKEHVRSASIMPRNAAAALAAGVILKGRDGEARLAAHEVIALKESARTPATLTPGIELIPQLQARAYGAEGRAAASVSGSRIVVECAAGQAPAGALLSSRGAALSSGAALAVQLHAYATDSFRFGAVDAAHARLGSPLALGSIAPGSSRPLLTIPPGLDTANWLHWAIACPPSDARLEISSLRLEPQAPQRAMPRRALWIWQPAAWQLHPDNLFNLLATHGADTVFITVPVTAHPMQVADPGELERFITRASALGVRIWAVAGDPRAVLPDQRAAYVDRARAYADYNRRVAAGAQLAGLQLDIEPYLNTGYAIDTEGWLSAYLDTLARVRTQAGMPLDVAIPFWWGRQPYRNGMLLDHLTPVVDVVTVMNYRTDRGQLLEFAEPFLAWAARAKRSVRIGLEAGPIADESMRIYRSSEAGELWLVPQGKNTLLLLLDEPRPGPAGESQTFAYSHTTRWRGSSISFRDNVGAMSKLLPGLETVWQAWPSFAGIALHGLDAE